MRSKWWSKPQYARGARAVGDARPIRPLAALVVRLVLWLVVGLGALGAVLGAVKAPATTRAGAAPALETRSVPAAAAGFAELAVRRWFQADGQSDQLARVFIEPPEVGDVRRPVVVRATNTVATRTIAAGYWSVTVAVEFSSAGAAESTWFVELGVAGDSNGRYLAVAEPAIVSDPRATTTGLSGPAQRAMVAPAPDDPVAATVAGFLAALLTGSGQVDRYLAPGVAVEAVSPPPFIDVRVERMASLRTGTVVVVRVVSRARTTGGGEWVLGYQLSLVERDGQWEVRSVSGAPSRASTSKKRSVSPPGGQVPASWTTTTVAVATSPGA